MAFAAHTRAPWQLLQGKQRVAGQCRASGLRVMSAVAAPTTFTSWVLRQERERTIDNELAIVLTSIATACKRISSLVSRAPVDGYLGLAGDANASGDEQKKLDIIANDVFCAAVRDSGRTSILVSEEEESAVALEAVGGGDYIVCFDPIDGSSNIDAAVPTGSIFGIYSPGECKFEADDSPETILNSCLLNTRKSGNELVSAGYCMYSSSTVLVLTVRNGVYGFTLDSTTGEFMLSHDNLKIPDPGQKIYSGNLGNTGLWAPELREYVDVLQDPANNGGKPYSYRYIGALVGDFHRTLLYGGIWLYPADTKAPNGKARLLYEVAPMSLIAEEAGGLATFGPLATSRVLDVIPQTVHQKSPLFVGSASEVRKLQAHLAARAKK